MISCGLGKEEREVEKKENGILKQVYIGSIVQSWWRNTHHFVVNGEKNVKAGTVGGNSSFLELLSSDCVKAEVVSLDRNLKTQIFQQYNSTETQRWITIDQMKKTETVIYTWFCGRQDFRPAHEQYAFERFPLKLDQIIYRVIFLSQFFPFGVGQPRDIFS